ncbi:MAG: hypothetical protein KDD50_16230, partial [Bdellovibrionales bacterium]|nr:hypothetical protein [Bdellovibrionales bacterium]
MRLRRFIFLSVAAVVITLTLLFSIITRHQWVDFSKKLVKDRKNFIAHLVEANIHAKENLLKESANLIQRNGELASSFLLTEEIKDSHILSEEINKLRKNNPSINVAVKPLNSSNKKITWENHGNKISIVHFSTLYHFNRPVADLQLTTPLLDDSLSQIMDMTSSKINFESKNGNLFPYFLSQFPGLYFQIVLADNSMVSMAENLTTTLLLTGIVSLILMGIILYISLSRKLIYPLHRMTDHLVNQSERLKHGLMPILSDFSESAFQEIKQIQKTTDQFSISLNSFRDIIEDKSKKAALVEMAQQVAHDIRSPLSALKIASQLIENNLKINESNDLMKKSILRINDIANDLLSKKQTLENNHDEQRIVADPIRTKETFMLSSMVDIIISEKRMQY